MLTEWEWEQAATGGREGYRYPWGEFWDNNRANTALAVVGRTTAVGMYPAGASPTGALDMAGNVWEWCLNEYRNPRRISLKDEVARSLRGGSFSRDQYDAQVNARNFDDPAFAYGSFGFRVCVAPKIEFQT